MCTLHTRVAELGGGCIITGALLTSPLHSNFRAHLLSILDISQSSLTILIFLLRIITT